MNHSNLHSYSPDEDRRIAYEKAGLGESLDSFKKNVKAQTTKTVELADSERTSKKAEIDSEASFNQDLASRIVANQEVLFDRALRKRLDLKTNADKKELIEQEIMNLNQRLDEANQRNEVLRVRVYGQKPQGNKTWFDMKWFNVLTAAALVTADVSASWLAIEQLIPQPLFAFPIAGAIGITEAAFGKIAGHEASQGNMKLAITFAGLASIILATLVYLWPDHSINMIGVAALLFALLFANILSSYIYYKRKDQYDKRDAENDINALDDQLAHKNKQLTEFTALREDEVEEDIEKQIEAAEKTVASPDARKAQCDAEYEHKVQEAAELESKRLAAIAEGEKDAAREAAKRRHGKLRDPVNGQGVLRTVALITLSVISSLAYAQDHQAAIFLDRSGSFDQITLSPETVHEVCWESLGIDEEGMGDNGGKMLIGSMSHDGVPYVKSYQVEDVFSWLLANRLARKKAIADMKANSLLETQGLFARASDGVNTQIWRSVLWAIHEMEAAESRTILLVSDYAESSDLWEFGKYKSIDELENDYENIKKAFFEDMDVPDLSNTTIIMIWDVKPEYEAYTLACARIFRKLFENKGATVKFRTTL